MNGSNNNHANILDLPNELLQIIFNKLNMIDVLYSLVDVNERFDQLLFDPLYIHNLNMTIKPLSDDTSLTHEILERICSKILPRVHREVTKISVEPNSMKRILHSVNYPRLDTLSLINFEEETLLHYITGMLFNFEEETLLHYITGMLFNFEEETLLHYITGMLFNFDRFN